MKIGKMLTRLVNGEALAEHKVESTENAFLRVQKKSPYEEPHAWLASTWRNRIKWRSMGYGDPDIRTLSLTETFFHACIKPPLCARSLGLYLIYTEHPQVMEKCPRLRREFARLMSPVIEAQENGTLPDMYRMYNPRMSEEIRIPGNGMGL
jgi:hypothetical protein